jgi:excisionase family DNA binding protein
MLKTSTLGSSGRKSLKLARPEEDRATGRATPSRSTSAAHKLPEPAAPRPEPKPHAVDGGADVLSTRQVAQLLGVGEATVKRWADSEELACFRADGGHRKFRLRDVAVFARKREMADGGEEGLDNAANVDEAKTQLERLAVDEDTDGCVALMSELRLAGMSLADIFDDVVVPVLDKVAGNLERCRLSSSEGQAAVSTLRDAISRAQPLAEPPGEPNRADRGTAVVASIAGEQHDPVARMTACLLRARCFEVLAPQANTPPADLAELVVRTRAQVVVLCSSAAAVPAQLQERLDLAALAVRPVGGRVVVAGPGAQKLKLPEGAHLLGRMSGLFIDTESPSRRRAGRG